MYHIYDIFIRMQWLDVFPRCSWLVAQVKLSS